MRSIWTSAQSDLIAIVSYTVNHFVKLSRNWQSRCEGSSEATLFENPFLRLAGGTSTSASIHYVGVPKFEYSSGHIYINCLYFWILWKSVWIFLLKLRIIYERLRSWVDPRLLANTRFSDCGPIWYLSPRSWADLCLIKSLVFIFFFRPFALLSSTICSLTL